jgi:hypothetical protein
LLPNAPEAREQSISIRGRTLSSDNERGLAADLANHALGVMTMMDHMTGFGMMAGMGVIGLLVLILLDAARSQARAISKHVARSVSSSVLRAKWAQDFAICRSAHVKKPTVKPNGSATTVPMKMGVVLTFKAAYQFAVLPF